MPINPNKPHGRLVLAQRRSFKRLSLLQTIPIALSGIEVNEKWLFANNQRFVILYAYLFFHLANSLLRESMKLIDSTAKEGVPLQLSQQQDLVLQDVADWMSGGPLTPLAESWLDKATEIRDQLRLLVTDQQKKRAERRSLRRGQDSH